VKGKFFGNTHDSFLVAREMHLKLKWSNKLEMPCIVRLQCGWYQDGSESARLAEGAN